MLPHHCVGRWRGFDSVGRAGRPCLRLWFSIHPLIPTLTCPECSRCPIGYASLLLMSYSAAASKLPGSGEAVTGCPSRRHQSSPPSNSLARNPSRASLYAPLVDALQPIPSQDDIDLAAVEACDGFGLHSRCGKLIAPGMRPAMYASREQVSITNVRKGGLESDRQIP